MARLDAYVKQAASRFVKWIDEHPRTGWYVAAWVSIVSLNTVWDLLERLLK